MLGLFGSNFGADSARVVFGGIEVSPVNVVSNSHTAIIFQLPPGAGTDIPVFVRVGAKSSNVMSFRYDMPRITQISPSVFDAEGDVLEVQGVNFGQTATAAGDVRIAINGEPCTNVQIGGVSTPLWQLRDGVPFLRCQTARTVVGQKTVTVQVAGYNVTYGTALKAQCTAGFYGQEAWTPSLLDDGSCAKPCSAASLRCMTLYNATAQSYEDPACWSVAPCTEVTLVDGARVNCTALTREDEYCLPCPPGSVCSASNGVLPVEPVAAVGYWRSIVSCGSERSHRSQCYAFDSCSPTEACTGHNRCSVGYTGEK